ncbi:hypothetical protein ABFX02_04G145000 [Erythranthe guttata]
MAAYAALVSLLNTIDHIENHPRLSISLDKKQAKSLGEGIDFLIEFIEAGYSHGVACKEAQVLESQIASAAYAAEDVIESHIVDQIHAGTISLLDLQTVLEGMDSIKKEVMQFKEECGSKELMPTTTSTRPRNYRRQEYNTLVGFDEEFTQLMESLVGETFDRKIISVVGIGGIGKTTITKRLYEQSFTAQYFEIRAWVLVSENYNLTDILLQLLSMRRSQLDSETDEELGELLYVRLMDCRYLIVLDDICCVEAWDKLKRYLPNNYKGSRIIVTTRIRNVSNHLGFPCIELNFLDEDKSWELFCEKAFSQADCPLELENIGREICRKCKGLPLSIVVVGGLLGRSYNTQEYTKSIAIDLLSTLNSGLDEDCLNILYLSYTYLSVHLKPCFLYMGVFPEERVIRVSRHIKFWVAEGFIRPNKTQSLEEIANDYLSDLIDMNLIVKHKSGLNGEIRYCIMHDLLRDLCLKIAHEEKFICTIESIPRGVDRERRIVMNEILPEEEFQSRVFPTLQSSSLTTRTLGIRIDRCPLPLNNRLLRVFKVDDQSVGNEIDLHEDIFDQVNLRCFVYEAYNLGTFMYGELPSSVSLLWNMQTIIIGGSVVAQSQFWEMRQLRHVYINSLWIFDPPPIDQDDDDFALRNLQTLRRVVNLTWSEDVCKRVPNVKKLEIIINSDVGSTDEYCLSNLDRLSKLESFICSYNEPSGCPSIDLLQNLTFSSSIRKLTLSGCAMFPENLTVIGSLPHLEVLKLITITFVQVDWVPVEGEFLRLKYLLIWSCSDLFSWSAERSHFPVLEKLVFKRMHELDEIPLDIGEIPTLGVIHLECCSESLAISAIKIAREQKRLGNERLQVRVEFENELQVENFWDNNVDPSERFADNNFQINVNFS